MIGSRPIAQPTSAAVTSSDIGAWGGNKKGERASLLAHRVKLYYFNYVMHQRENTAKVTYIFGFPNIF